MKKSNSIRGTVRSFAKQFRTDSKMRGIVIAVALTIVILLAVLIYLDIQKNSIYDYEGGAEEATHYLEYKGKKYEYNKYITSILLIGVDSTGDIKVSKDYGEQARADHICLISFDRRNHSVKVLPISRDTITGVTTFSASGYETGVLETHIGYAFSVGNGGNASSMNVCHSVENLLYGTEVFKYVTTNIDSIAYANQLIGGVTVTVPNNDLAFKYPEMTKGARVAITDENAADFLRYRDTSVEGSNNGRMERQQAFLEAYIKKLESMSRDDYVEMWNKLSTDKTKIRTNMSKNMFMNLIANIKKYKYDPAQDNLRIEGTNTVLDGYDAFYPDEDKLLKLVVDNYFKEYDQ